MRIRLTRFNIIFVLLLALVPLGTACRSTKEKDDPDSEATTLRFHLEANQDALDRTVTATVGRPPHFQLTVSDTPFLTEIYVVEADMVEGVGGIEIRLKFDRQGTWLLENYTVGNKGKHIAIYCQFGDTRWLAAPLIKQGIKDGAFVFTPDASRDEVERIVRGLQNVASEVKKENK